MADVFVPGSVYEGLLERLRCAEVAEKADAVHAS